MPDRTTWWKVLDGVTPVHRGTGRYPGRGRWARTLTNLEACERGYHVARGPQVLDWLPSMDEFVVWQVTPGDTLIDAGNKWVTDRVRLDVPYRVDGRMLRLFAADCAEGALLGERARGREPDALSWAAVEVVRRYAVGAASDSERAAARDAAWSAAGGAAWDAAWSAAGGAAWSAAWGAAAAAAWGAAAAAAGAADWTAAGAADWTAAGAAAWAAQYDRFIAYLTGSELTPVTALYGVA